MDRGTVILLTGIVVAGSIFFAAVFVLARDAHRKGAPIGRLINTFLVFWPWGIHVLGKLRREYPADDHARR